MSLPEILIGKKDMREHPYCLGLYIDVDEIYVSQCSKKNGSIVLESLVRVPIQGVDKTQLKPLDLNEQFFAMDNWLEALGKVTSKKKWNTDKVVVSLSPAFCLIRHFVMPSTLKRSEWKDAIPLTARKYIHFSFEKAVIAYHVYEFTTAATKRKSLGVVFSMTTKSIIERLEKGLKSVNLELLSVESSCLSLGRAFNDSDKEVIGAGGGRIYSFFGKNVASFVFLNDNIPLLLRDVDIAGSLPTERRRLEITNSTEFISKQLERDPFEEAVIVGSEAELWQPALEAEVKKPVRRWNLKEVYGINVRYSGEVAAIGAACKFYDNKIPDLDFTKGSRLGRYEFDAAWTMWKVAGVILILFALLFVKEFIAMKNIGYTLEKERKGHEYTLDDFKGLTGGQIKTNPERIKAQNNTLENIVKNDADITPMLVDIVDSVPKEVWLTQLSYQDSFPSNGDKSRSWKIQGFVRTGKTDGKADLEIGQKFRETLAKSPLIRKICPEQKLAIRYITVAGSSSVTGSNKEVSIAKETEFEISCNISSGSK